MQDSVRELKFYFSQHSSEEPFVDIYETEDHLVCEADLPGVDPDQIVIKTMDDILIIEGNKIDDEEQYDKNRTYLCMERNKESFRRIINIPMRVNFNDGRAEYSNGVVKIEFPKFKEKVVKIKVAKR